MSRLILISLSFLAGMLGFVGKYQLQISQSREFNIKSKEPKLPTPL